MASHHLGVFARSIPALLFAASFSARAAGVAAGRWEGFALIPQRELPLVIDLAQDAAGQWSGSVIVPGMGVKGAPLADITVKPQQVAFTVPDALGGLSLKAQLLADGALSGEFQQGGNLAPFTLKRIGPAQVEPVPRSTAVAKELEGEWRGSYELMGYPRQVTLSLTNQPGGTASVRFVIVGKRTNEVSVDLVTQEGDFVTLESRAFQITVEGRHRKEGDEFRGTFRQGPFELPLNLRRTGSQ
jgi:hypothetical protein